MRLWITDGGLDFDQTGEELGNERAGGDCRVNELGYDIGNGGDMAFGSGEKGGGPLVRGWGGLLRKRMS